jgi:hypothetical protein
VNRWFKESKGHANSFSASWASKKHLGRSREVMFQLGEWPWETINCILDNLKCDFYEVDEAMFRGIDRPCEKIISFLGIEKETWTMSRM